MNEDEDKNKSDEEAEGGELSESEGGEGEGEGKKKKKKGKKLKIIIAALILIIVIATPTAMYFMGFFKKKIQVSGGEIHKGEEVVGKDGVIEQPVFYDMEEFIANLNVGSKTPSFLKMTVSLELQGESQIPVVESKMPRIRDGFQIYLRELRQEDLQGSAGLYRLREELLLRINKIVYPAKINDILFKEILVQ
jgi:flagellar FliL protein